MLAHLKIFVMMKNISVPMKPQLPENFSHKALKPFQHLPDHLHHKTALNNLELYSRTFTNVFVKKKHFLWKQFPTMGSIEMHGNGKQSLLKKLMKKKLRPSPFIFCISQVHANNKVVLGAVLSILSMMNHHYHDKRMNVRSLLNGLPLADAPPLHLAG